MQGNENPAPSGAFISGNRLRLRARLTALVALAAFAALAAALLLGAAQAQERQPSYYEPFTGQPFFLLSDAAYGSDETASVRLEAPGGGDMGSYGGVDIVVYRVPAPLEFLKKQRNLHRVEVAGDFQGEGLANTLGYLWDSWWKQSRQIWRKLFSNQARLAVTRAQPALASSAALKRPTGFRQQRQYQLLKGFEAVEQFRYPIGQAEPIAPPKGVRLDGSSSEFVATRAGNVMIPIGKRKPGLYLVEAIVGAHRATTLVFVGDTLGVTKVSSGQMLVWAARRDNGAAVADVDVAWSDGAGVLQSGRTGANGVAAFERASPEHTYVVGEDRAGGVFVSENFYYDSEIYNTKIYAVTDRPLYRPGDEVNVKFLAREFKSARASQPAAAAPLQLTLLDPNGTPLLTQALQLNPETGAEARFRLPPQAGAGGYELRFTYRDSQYGAAFRVAEYVKPHFEIAILPAKPDFKTGEVVNGRIALRYPDGKPVRGARLSLTLRAQRNTMVEGELRYGGQFPVELKTQEMATGADGDAGFALPAAAEPSRYILTVQASDGAAYRVKGTRELMIERSASVYRLRAARQFSAPGETVRFALSGDGRPDAAQPARWEMVQLEKRRTTSGAFEPGRADWDVAFAEPGSYQLSLRDARNNLLAAASHWVSGAGLKGTPGHVEIVFEHERYRPGETAEALITFADPVEQALLTLERDQVERVGLLAGGAGADWVEPRRVAPNQWRARIPVRADYGPNITFSVAYARGGDFVFENAGLQIVEPRIELRFATDREVYRPGQQVTLDVSAQLDGKPVSTLVALGVVDEMVYVLQPEIAPDIADFFYHPRRNNVRTTASLSFISYDLAQGRAAGAPARHNYNERGVKVLERPRRDNVDTALWAPLLKTGADGRARVTFTMPDALTRWRITGRAMDAQGRVGQRTAYLRSDQPFYAKWGAPDWMRAGDAPRAALAVFNQGADEQPLEVSLGGAAGKQSVSLAARRGVNYVQFALGAGGPLRVEVRHKGQLVDALDTVVRTQPATWSSPRAASVALTGAVTPLRLPAGAGHVRVSFARGAAAQFARIADDLIDYPYGGVEQTASRLIPLALGARNLGAGPEAERLRARLLARLQSERLRLVSMAGPKARFGWWGKLSEDSAVLTAYAYYADWHAARALGIALPPEHWQNLLNVYGELGSKEPPLQRALALWMAQEMGLPVKTLASGLADQLAAAAAAAAPAVKIGSGPGLLEDERQTPMTLALLAVIAKQSGLALPPALAQRVPAAWAALRADPAPLAQGLLMLAGQLDAGRADPLLAGVSGDMRTYERALTLAWVHKALGGAPSGAAPELAPEATSAGGWRKSVGVLGAPWWSWSDPAGAPAELQLASAAPAGAVAMIGYDSYAHEKHALPVRIERRILRLTREKDGFLAEPVAPGAALRTDQLYLDEVTLTPAAGARHRFGVLEVALPPGAAVEPTTWGVALKAGGRTSELERASHEERRDGYTVPIEPLNGEQTVRHLLRFGQKGRYVLPPARFYRLYQPEQKALEGEGGGKGVRTLLVE